MDFRDTLSKAESTEEALDELVSAAESFVAEIGRKPDIAVVFVTSHHREGYADVARRLQEASGAAHLIGCTAESVIGGGREIERSPAISLWLASMPDATIESFHTFHETSDAAIGFTGLPGGLFDEDGNAVAEPGLMILLGDPFTFPVDEMLRTANDAHPGLIMSGGMASAAMAPGQNALFLGGEVRDEGAVGLLISGGVRFDTIVSQGCRPIGTHYVVTDSHDNLIAELGGKPTKDRMQELFATLTEEDRELFQHGPQIGVVINETREDFRRGDFLIRGVLGWDSSESLAVGDFVRRGQTIQFHVRDAVTASEDLEVLLDDPAIASHAPTGGLIFSCNGRGTRLFSAADHDVSTVRDKIGDIPLSGFFAGGEVGPIGGKNFLHGFTASVVLFSEP